MCLLPFRLAILGRCHSSACAKMAAHLIARLLPVVLMERPGAFKARMRFICFAPCSPFRLAFLPSRPDSLNRLSLAMSVARWRPPSGRDGPHTLREGRALYLQACQIGHIAAQTVIWCDECGLTDGLRE
jgi:hypothetical protein